MTKHSYQEKTKAQLIAEIAKLQQRLKQWEAIDHAHLQAIDALRESEAKYRILLDESSDPIFTFFPDGQYRYVNKAFAEGVGRKQEEIIGKKVWDVFPKDEADKRFAAVKWVFENGETKPIEVRVPRPEGDHYYITTIKPVFGEQGKVVSVICISKDITERKQIEQELRQLSTHDTLTGLYNRNFFEVELARIQLSRLYPISIVIADMDNLKMINDRYGHGAGDLLIRKVADALRHSFRAEDIIARIGGDEFAVLLTETDEAVAQSVIQRLQATLENERDPLLQLSLGQATGDEGSYLPDIMRLADDRMYQNKRSNKSRRDSSMASEEPARYRIQTRKGKPTGRNPKSTTKV